MEPSRATLLETWLRSAQDCGPRGSPSAPLSSGHLTPRPPLLSLSGNQVFPEVTRLLTSHTGNTSNSEDILSSACYTVRNLMASQPQMAKQYFSSSMVNNIINLCRSRWAGRAVVSTPHTLQSRQPHNPLRRLRCAARAGPSAGREPGQGRLESREVPEAKSAVELSPAAKPRGCTKGTEAAHSQLGVTRGRGVLRGPTGGMEAQTPPCGNCILPHGAFSSQDKGWGTRMGENFPPQPPRRIPGYF